MGPITSILPVPRTVTVGGEPVVISELRLRDLATLQAILDGTWPDPLAEIQDSLPADRKARNRLLVRAYERAEIGPPVYGTARGHEYFATPEGGALLLWVAGRQHTPDLGPPRAARLYTKATVGEIDRVLRIAHGVPTLKAIENFLWARPPGEGAGSARKTTWAEMIDELARERNWTYSYIYDLTITEWLAARNHGKQPEPGRVIGPGEDAAAIAQEQAELWAEAMAEDAEDESSGTATPGGQGENPPC